MTMVDFRVSTSGGALVLKYHGKPPKEISPRRETPILHRPTRPNCSAYGEHGVRYRCSEYTPYVCLSICLSLSTKKKIIVLDCRGGLELSV